jgi:PDZ domain-containing protein
MYISGFAVSLLIAGLSILPSPYAIGSPGPTFDTLSEVEGVRLVSVAGAPTYDTTGELRLTTVSVSRGSTHAFTMGHVIKGWLLPSQYVVPEEEVFGTPEERESFEEMTQQAWVSSQESAAVSALEATGVEVPASLRIAAVDDFSHGLELLEVDDVLVAIDGRPLTSFSGVSRALDSVDPGEDVTLTVARAGSETDVTFATVDSGDGRALLGIYVDPTFIMPIDVTVRTDSVVGGPSAGLMFSLAIMNLLSPEDELAGARVAGTGAITADGDVQPIGGIRLKLHGAVAAGSTHFLAPKENCSEVVGHIPGGLNVIAVETLDDAYEAIVRIGEGRSDELPTC